ncbi:FOLC protein, partial [Pedionomus torquatus]|nr:FOLC protein [Pedionomus torquatus]
VSLCPQVDLAVVEVGIGGAYDCTNIIRAPVVCGISSLGIDHTSILGDTMEKIAWQKGGIFKPGVPAFTVAQPERPLAVLRDRAQELECPLYLCPDLDAFEGDHRALELGLAGAHQRSNAALALQLARTWLQRRGWEGKAWAWGWGQGVGPCCGPWGLSGTPIPPGLGEPKEGPPVTELVGRPVPLAPAFQPTDAMIQGLRDTEWLGRTQVLPRGPVTWYLDGAHTTSSIQACVRWFRQAALNQDKPHDGSEVRVLLFNATGDRDTAALLKLLVVRFWGRGHWGEVPGFSACAGTCFAACVGSREVELMPCAVCPHLSVPFKGFTALGAGGDLGHPLPGPNHRNPNGVELALRWVAQGRDPRLAAPMATGAHPHPAASSGAVLLRGATAVRVL